MSLSGRANRCRANLACRAELQRLGPLSGLSSAGWGVSPELGTLPARSKVAAGSSDRSQAKTKATRSGLGRGWLT
ncbi:hypothetical protein Droror1_Dr00000057 [Drosera rotundifolia]